MRNFTLDAIDEDQTALVPSDAGIVTNVSTITEATARLEAATAATALAARRVGRDRRHVLDAADLEARARERAQRRLGAGARRLRLVACAEIKRSGE